MRRSTCACLFVLVLSVFSAAHQASGQELAQLTTEPATQATTPPPTVIPLNGQLKDAAGNPRTGTVALKLSLYTAANDTTPIWIEDQLAALDAYGNYAVYFGATRDTGLPPELFATGSARWAGVTPAGEAELPRTLVLSVPYASKAEAADSLSGKRATDFVLSENLEGILKAWGVPLSTDGTGLSSDGTQMSSTSSSSSSTPNTVVKYLDSLGTMGGSAITETGGNVGIGTTTPGSTLHVVGATTTSVVQIYPFTARPSATSPVLYQPTIGHLGIATNDAERIRVDASGNVGIGTSAPASPLHVVGATTASAYQIYPSGPAPVITSPVLYQPIDGQLGIATNAAERLRIDASGNVGIGTATPTVRLDITGHARVTGNLTVDTNITVAGNIAAKYQDVAEWVDAVEPLPAATVVTADLKQANRVRKSVKAYDTAVLGVVSAQPGIILGEKGEGKVPVAQSGRVKVKVDARYGAIRPGDLLVTSSIAGYAMRSRPMRNGMHRPGTIIGKALEPLAKGRGEILVLLTLQ